MKTLQELINILNALPDTLAEYMPGELETVSKDFIALRVTQIRREGLKNKPGYSVKPGIPAFLLKGKNNDYPTALTAAGRALIDKRIKAKVTPQNKYANFVSHKEMRNAQGLQTNYVDLSYSNDMLNTLGIVSKSSARTFYRANIGSLTPKGGIKFGGNYKRYGDFFQPDQKIRDIIGNASAIRVGRFLNIKLGGTITVSLNS